MSKVWNVLRTIPKAVGGYESELPRPEGTRDFPGKGLLTALVDVSGSEIQRRRAIQDKARWTVAKPLLDNYWQAAMHANPEEMELYSEKLTEALGYDKGLKKWLQEDLFPKGQQIAMASRVVGGIPQPVQTGAPQPPAQSGESTGGPSAASTETPYGATPVPEPPTPWLSPPMSQAPTTQQQPQPVFGPGFLQGPPAPTAAATFTPAPTPELRQPPTGLYSTITGMVGAPSQAPASNPMQSLLRKISPPAPTETEKSALRVAEDYLKESFKAGTELDKTKALERYKKELAAQYPEMDVQVQEDVDVNGQRMMIFYDRKSDKTIRYLPQAPKEQAGLRPDLDQVEGTWEGQTTPKPALRKINPTSGQMQYFDPLTNKDITASFKLWHPAPSSAGERTANTADIDAWTGMVATGQADLTDISNFVVRDKVASELAKRGLLAVPRPIREGISNVASARDLIGGIENLANRIIGTKDSAERARLSILLNQQTAGIGTLLGRMIGGERGVITDKDRDVAVGLLPGWVGVNFDPKYVKEQLNYLKGRMDAQDKAYKEGYFVKVSTPGSAGASNAGTGGGDPNAVSQDTLVNFIMSRNRGLTREQAIEALNNTSPETIAGLRREAAGAGGTGAGTGGAGGAGSERIRIRVKATGQTGTIEQREFDPQTMEKINR